MRLDGVSADRKATDLPRVTWGRNRGTLGETWENHNQDEGESPGRESPSGFKSPSSLRDCHGHRIDRVDPPVVPRPGCRFISKP